MIPHATPLHFPSRFPAIPEGARKQEAARVIKDTSVQEEDQQPTMETEATASARVELQQIKDVVSALDGASPTIVTKSPREILKDIFEIQGIDCDPSDVDPAWWNVAQRVRSSGGVCDGKDTGFDVFISYRVATEADLAEKLYYYLKSCQINAFLDRKCLPSGEPWRANFLKGLCRSRKFVCLLSTAALKTVRDHTKSHEYDNVLLEFSTGVFFISLYRPVGSCFSSSPSIKYTFLHLCTSPRPPLTRYHPLQSFILFIVTSFCLL